MAIHREWNSDQEVMDDQQLISEVTDVNQTAEEEEARLREIERSMTEIDEIEDFEKHDNTDLIYRQYEPLDLPHLDHYERFDRLGQSSWKTGRPSQLISCLTTLNCVFQTTIMAGSVVGLILALVVYLDVNLADLCYSHTSVSEKLPASYQKIKIVSSMVSGILVQLWNLVICLLVFKWTLIRNTNILSWNILAALIEGIYRLIIGIFVARNASWTMYPSYAIFIFVNFFNSITIAKHFKAQNREVSKLVLRLSAQFLFGIPLALIFISWINPLYKILSSPKQAVLACFVPLIVIIPKAAARKMVLGISSINHPGTSVYLLIAMYTSIALLYRMLQVQIDELGLFLVVSIAFGIQGTLERVSLPYIDYMNHKLLTKDQTQHEFMTPRRKRLMADLYLMCMMTEPIAILVSCTSIGTLMYLYGHDQYGYLYNGTFIVKTAAIRIVSAMSIEFIFNLISTKVETYHYNMPVVKVWQRKRLWLFLTLLINAILTMLCFSRVFYAALSTDDMFDGTLNCAGPFQRPRLNFTKSG
eukprot:gene19275-21201_t